MKSTSTSKEGGGTLRPTLLHQVPQLGYRGGIPGESVDASGVKTLPLDVVQEVEEERRDLILCLLVQLG